MSLSADISWQVLRQIVHDWAGTSAELAEVRPLEGGSVSTTLELETRDGQRAVLKITPHRVDRTYGDEACQLNLLRELGIPVPQVYHWVTGTLDHPFSYLLEEFVEGQDLASVRNCCTPDEFDTLQADLAEVVLRLHSNTSDHYMKVSMSDPKRFDAWATCYRDIYDPIWHEVEKSGLLPAKTRKVVAKVHERLPSLLAHDDRPRLTHGDLWSTNLLLRQDSGGRWHLAALLDPNCRYAHCEAELAYLELFHTVTPAFLKGYQQAHRLPPEYHRVRKPVYHLYEMLNHVCMFGQEYVRPTLAAVERAAGLI